MKKLLMVFLIAISSTVYGQGSQLSQLDGKWFSPDSNYGYILTNGIGIATQTNSQKFKVGDKIIELQSTGNNSFRGRQIYQDGKFYPILSTLISADRMLVQGEHSVAWYMDRVRGTTYTPQSPLTPPTWDLAGSKVTVTIINGILNVYFLKPNRYFVNDGARSDSLLISGRVDGEIIQGVARRFVKNCGVFTYPVSGTISFQKMRIDLRGTPPVVDSQTCTTKGIYRNALILQQEESAPVSSSPIGQSKLPQCQGTNIAIWNLCIGAYTFSDGIKFIVEFKDGKFNGQGTYMFPSGSKYVGEFKDNKFNGQGTFTYSDGGKYVGEFKDGKRDGQGTFTFADGSKYVGEFKDNKFNGQGTYTFSDGEKYVGEFKDGGSNGKGTSTFPNGEKYVGEYKHGMRHGQGISTFPNGEKYVGEFKLGMPNGQGTRTSSNGTVLQAGRWAHGIFVGLVSTSTVAASKGDPKTLAERATQGDAEAQFQYGMTFISGTYAELQPRIAIKWLSEAAKQGHGPAQRQIASMFDLGVTLSRMESPIQVRN